MTEQTVIDPRHWVAGRWERCEGDEWRYYQAFLRQDLWGDWHLTRIWGGRIRRAGRVRETPVINRDAGINAMRRIGRERRAHRYRLIQLDGRVDGL